MAEGISVERQRYLEQAGLHLTELDVVVQRLERLADRLEVMTKEPTHER